MRAPTPSSESNPPSQAAASQANAPPYPPCVFRSHDEKQLYRRLKTIYEQHSSTWDQESRDAWPWLVERASLKPTTTKKVTSHLIAKTLRDENITWAHIVVLKVIFKQGVFASRKMMKMIRRKYPSANLNTFAFHEDYKEDIVASMWDAGSKEMALGVDADEEERDDSPSESLEKGGPKKDEEAEDEKKPAASSSMPSPMKDEEAEDEKKPSTSSSMPSSMNEEEAEDEKKPATSSSMPSSLIKTDEGVRLKQEERDIFPLDALSDMPAYPSKNTRSAAAMANKRKSPVSEADYDSDQTSKFKLWAKIPLKAETAEKKEKIDKIKIEAETDAPPAKRAKTTRVSSKPRGGGRRVGKKNKNAETEEDKGVEYRNVMEAIAALATSMTELGKMLGQIARPGEA